MIASENGERARSCTPQRFGAGIPEDDGRCRFIWTTDLLPDEIAPYISGQMDLGVAAMKKAFAG